RRRRRGAVGGRDGRGIGPEQPPRRARAERLIMPDVPVASAPSRAPRRAVSWAAYLGSFPRATLIAAWRAAQRFATSDNLTYASSISFFSLLSLFPFLMLTFSVLGMLTADEASRLAVFDFVLRYFPRQFDFVTRQIDAFRAQRITLGLAGSLLMLWSSLGVFGAITTAVNYAWRVER